MRQQLPGQHLQQRVALFALLLQALRELHGERTLVTRLTRPAVELCHHRIRGGIGGRNLVGEGVGGAARVQRRFHAHGEPPQLVDQRNPHDGIQRPQLPHRQRDDLLIAEKKTDEAFRFEAVVGVLEYSLAIR